MQIDTIYIRKDGIYEFIVKCIKITILFFSIYLFIVDNNISIISSISFKSSHSKFISIKFKNKILNFSYRHANLYFHPFRANKIHWSCCRRTTECATSAYTKTQNRFNIQCESTFRVVLFTAIIRSEIFDQSFFPSFFFIFFVDFLGNSGELGGKNSPLAKFFVRRIYLDIRLENKNIAVYYSSQDEKGRNALFSTGNISKWNFFRGSTSYNRLCISLYARFFFSPDLRGSMQK